ncbi:MAG: hypothetical protein E7374_01775 [Clostridiales bacterium]|nr:hypothetical protein [Clostridiales bacterium]
MNYNEGHLEYKTFNFFRQLLYYIALSVCVLLVVTLILVNFGGFKLSHVVSNSQKPYVYAGDMILVKTEKEYKVGDILQFDKGLDKSVTHRCVRIVEHNGKNYYVCHGDAVQNTDGSYGKSWKWEVERLKNMTYSEIANENIVDNVQIITEENIEGKAVMCFSGYGKCFEFVQKHTYLLIAMIVSIWCVCTTIEYELEMRNTRRMFL